MYYLVYVNAEYYNPEGSTHAGQVELLTVSPEKWKSQNVSKEILLKYSGVMEYWHIADWCTANLLVIGNHMITVRQMPAHYFSEFFN